MISHRFRNLDKFVWNMHGRNQRTQTCNTVFTFLLICLNWNCSIQCGTNIVFLDEDFNYTVSSGSRLHIQCFLEFSQSVTISFHINPLVSNSTRVGSQAKYNYQSNIQANGSLHVLTIKDVEKSDKGRYFCASDRDIIKQMTLTVTDISEGSARCKMSVQQVFMNNDSGRPSYQFHCSTPGFPNANISAFLYGQSVDEQANLTVRRAGNGSEKTLSFSSNFDYLSSNPLFYCNVTDESYSPCIHEGTCHHSSSIASTNYWTYFNGTVTTTYQQNSTNLPVTGQTQDGYENLNFVIIIVVSLLIISFLLTFIGIKLFFQVQLAVMANSNNKKSRSHETELNDVADEPVECVEPATRNTNYNVPHNAIDSSRSNEGFVEGMVMVKNELYESSNEALLTCIPMVKNDIYESIAGVATYEVESQMYSIIQRNKSCFDS